MAVGEDLCEHVLWCGGVVQPRLFALVPRLPVSACILFAFGCPLS